MSSETKTIDGRHDEAGRNLSRTDLSHIDYYNRGVCQHYLLGFGQSCDFCGYKKGYEEHNRSIGLTG